MLGSVTWTVYVPLDSLICKLVCAFLDKSAHIYTAVNGQYEGLTVNEENGVKNGAVNPSVIVYVALSDVRSAG